MEDYEKAYLFFDTNSLECRHSGKALYLSQFTVTPKYYEIEKLIQSLGLSDRVEICIPEIVWLELQEHLTRYYKSLKDCMSSKISEFKKSFGYLAEINCDYKDCKTEQEYAEYASRIAQDFLNNPRVTATIIPCPKDEKTVQGIINQAIHSNKPFRSVKVNSKEYTDAGFKDALIFSTILNHTGDQLGILVSNDNDFTELFNEIHHSNLKICNSINDIQMLLYQTFNVVSDDMIMGIIHTDEYLLQRIITECGLDENVNITQTKIISCEPVEDNVHTIFSAIVNGEKLAFDILYNISAKELLEASYEIFEEGEE